MDENGTKVLKCPAGHEPKSCSYDKRNQQCHVSFMKEYCANCPYAKQCKPKVYKRVAKKVVSRKSIVRAQVREKMQTEPYKLMARIRNGVETIPSLLKNRYHANEMPVHGLQRIKFFTGSKIAAINFQKIFRFRKGTGNYAQNPVLCWRKGRNSKHQSLMRIITEESHPTTGNLDFMKFSKCKTTIDFND